MEYLDFELKVGASDAGVYPICVVRSPAGETDAVMRLPAGHGEMPPLPPEGTPAVEALRNVTAGPASAPRSSKEGVAAEPPEVLGLKLFEALLPDEVRSLYRESVAIARQQEKGLRVRLRIEPPEVAVLPWEFVFDGREGIHIALSNQTPITRYLQVERPPRTLTVEPPLRILGLIASPNDRPRLDVARERAQMELAVQHLVEAGHVTIEWVEGQTARDLQRALQAPRGPWHVFHFIGHGGFDPETGEGIIALCSDDGSGGSHHMGAAQLANLLGDHPSMRLAILNSCEGGRGTATEVFSSTGSVIIRRGVPAVVSMQNEISDEAALEFSRAFYDCLAEHMPVDMAVTEARKAIDNHWEHKTAEWGTPVLHMRSPDGQLFNLDMAARIFRGPVPAADTPPKEKPTRVAVPGRAPAAQIRDRAERSLAILLRKVKRFWVDGVLGSSLENSGLVDLDMELMHGAVESPWAVDLPDGGEEKIAPDRSVADVFEEQGGSLLILGEPGSGKSTALLVLARDLIARAEADSSRVVPVVFNLSSWGRTTPRLGDWLLSELGNKYQVPKKTGEWWLAENRLLPLLDGLDEVRPEARNACVEAINEFTEAALVGTVVCCRYREYTELSARLTLNAAIRLQRLSRTQVLECVASGGERQAALARLLPKDSTLLIEARSPLMLSLMLQAYADLPVADVEAEDLATTEARRTHILETFVDRQLRRHGGATPSE